MTDKTKLIVAGGSIVIGAGLILWSMRDPNRGYYEQPKQELLVTIDQVPAPVRSAINRESAGGVVMEIQKEITGGEIKYDADIALNGRKVGLKIAEDGSILERKAKKLKPTESS